MSFSYIAPALAIVLVAGYIGQKYGLPAPAPKIAGIDLGTTFSSIGIYHAVTGETTIIPDEVGKRSVPSVVAFLPNGTILVGTRAVEQQEKNPTRTIYDAKRFIGRTFEENNENFKVVISVPAEFQEKQRNSTGKAAELAGMEVRRVISEPTAAALAYGLHKKKGVEHVVVVDLGGGTLDVSVLWLQGGVFVTQSMAGNNRLGGQDFNDRVQKHILNKLKEEFGKVIDDKEDLQQIRLEVERVKLSLTNKHAASLNLNLKSVGKFSYELTRNEFEAINKDLFTSIIQPIEAALADATLQPEDVDEIVLVGGSTQIPAVRRIVGHYFKKAPNYGIDPELAVVTGASVQAGVIGGGWPLQVAAMELPTKRRKRHFYTEKQKKDESDL